jgi:SAM-dependent methyltransferase
MPTISSAYACSTPGQPHDARQAAESFGTDPGRYDRARPRYPRLVVDRIIAQTPGPELLDVGIGTGVSAQPFQAAGCRVLGVDVDPRMAEFARGRGFEVEVAKFEDWDPAGRTFHAVIAGMTWHWVDPAAGAVKAAALLRPGGLLAPFWNVHRAPPELALAFADVYRRVVPDTPFAAVPGDPMDAYSHILSNTTHGIRASGAFGEPERLRLDWERTYTADEWVDQVPTFGGHSTLPPDKLDQLLTGLRAAITDIGGSFTMRYSTLAVLARTTPRPALSRERDDLPRKEHVRGGAEPR